MSGKRSSDDKKGGANCFATPLDINRNDLGVDSGYCGLVQIFQGSYVGCVCRVGGRPGGVQVVRDISFHRGDIRLCLGVGAVGRANGAYRVEQTRRACIGRQVAE